MSAHFTPSLVRVAAGALWGWLIFTGLVSWLSFSSVVIATFMWNRGGGIQNDSVATIVGMALVFGFWAGLVAAVVSFFVTGVVGVPLARLVSHWMRNVSSLRAHIIANFTIGAFSAAIALVLFAAIGDGYDLVFTTFVPIVALALAGTSASLGWVITWRVSQRSTAHAYAESPAPL